MLSFFTISTRKKYLLLVPILTIWIAKCTKDSQESQNPDIAEYYFINNNNNCSVVLLNGNYYKGIGLNPTNNVVEISAYVTKKGSYDISTSKTNGTYFKVSGVIPDTGEYTFRLRGRGIPVKKEVTRFSLVASDQSSCSFNISFLDFADSINAFEAAWEFFDNGVFHHGSVDTSYVDNRGGIVDFYFSGHESTNSNATFEMSFKSLRDGIIGTYTDSLNQNFSFRIDQQEIFSTYLRPSTVKIDRYSYETDIIKGRFSWSGLNNEGVLHEVTEGKFHVYLSSH